MKNNTNLDEKRPKHHPEYPVTLTVRRHEASYLALHVLHVEAVLALLPFLVLLLLLAAALFDNAEAAGEDEQAGHHGDGDQSPRRYCGFSKDKRARIEIDVAVWCSIFLANKEGKPGCRAALLTWDFINFVQEFSLDLLEHVVLADLCVVGAGGVGHRGGDESLGGSHGRGGGGAGGTGGLGGRLGL